MATDETELAYDDAPDECRQWLVTAHQSSSQAYDKAIMTLAGGALAISITFIHDVAPQPVAKSLLVLAWLCLALSLRRVPIQVGDDGGVPAEPPKLESAVPNWAPGHMIHMGRRTLRVVALRDDDAEQPPVLVVEEG